MPAPLATTFNTWWKILDKIKLKSNKINVMEEIIAVKKAVNYSSNT